MEQVLPTTHPKAPTKNLSHRLTDADVRLAKCLFARELTSDEIGQLFSLDGSQVRRIARGDNRPQVKGYIDDLARDLMEEDRHELIRARKKALRVLVKGLKSENEGTSTQCALGLRRELAGGGGITVNVDGNQGDVIIVDAAQAALILKTVEKVPSKPAVIDSEAV